MPTIRGMSINFSEFPDLVRGHRRKYPDTPKVETQASALVLGGFDEQLCVDFVRSVCKWGGFAGIGGKVVLRNRKPAIAEALRGSYLRLAEGNAVAGLRKMNGLYGLGRPSFASKHLRFLAPRKAVILDRIISSKLGYALNLDGYGQLLADCEALTAEINKTTIEHPFRPSEWYISDIELAGFAQIQRF